MKKLTTEEIAQTEVIITVDDVKNAIKQASSTIKQFVKAKLNND